VGYPLLLSRDTPLSAKDKLTSPTSDGRSVRIVGLRTKSHGICLKNGVFWDVTLCGSCKKRRFGGTKRFHHQGNRVNANVPASLIHVTLMMEALISLKCRFLQEPHGVNIPEDAFLHSHRLGHLKSYIALTGWTLKWRCNVSPVKYDLGFYIPEDGVLHSHRRENLKSYITLAGWAL
jgi:hypothetical protein